MNPYIATIQESLAAFDEKFGNLGSFRSDELGILNFDAKKLLAIKDFIHSEIEKSFNDGLNLGVIQGGRQVRQELIEGIRSKVEGLRKEATHTMTRPEHYAEGGIVAQDFNFALNAVLKILEGK